MQIRDRIKELRRVPARELRPNPKNWRTHGPAQQEALRGVLAEIGYAGALLARQLDDGALELVDGHLRAETTPEAIVPVLVLDLSAAEADKLLATFDPIATMAGADAAAMQRLIASIEIENPALRTMADEWSEKQWLVDSSPWSEPGNSPARSDGTSLTTDHRPLAAARPTTVEVPTLFQIVVECDGETGQRELYERLSSEGYKCKVLTL